MFLSQLLTSVKAADAIPVNINDHPVHQLIPGNLNWSLNGIWGRFFTVFYLVLGMIAVIMLFYAAIQYISSGGNTEKTKKARQTIINVVLGIILLVASYAIIGLIISIATSTANQA